MFVLVQIVLCKCHPYRRNPLRREGNPARGEGREYDLVVGVTSQGQEYEPIDEGGEAGITPGTGTSGGPSTATEELKYEHEYEDVGRVAYADVRGGTKERNTILLQENVAYVDFSG